MKTKMCNKCHSILELESFSKNGKGTKSHCKKCCMNWAREDRKVNKEKYSSQQKIRYNKDKEPFILKRRLWGKSNKLWQKNYDLKKKYGITLLEYNEMIENQKGLCKICNKPDEHLHVDHNHKTGEVRALLCKLCNTALGKFKEDITILESAINYIKEHNE